MNIIGKTVCHIKDGFGTITEYYPANDYIKVQFSSGVIRPYHFPHDFYPEGVLSSSPREIIDLALQLPRSKYSYKNTRFVKTANKDLFTFYNNCLSIFADLSIPFDESAVLLTVNRRLTTLPGRIIKNEAFTDAVPHYIIQINPTLLMSNVPDARVYQTLLKLMNKTTGDIKKDGKGGQQRQNAALISRETGYTVSTDVAVRVFKQPESPVFFMGDSDFRTVAAFAA